MEMPVPRAIVFFLLFVALFACLSAPAIAQRVVLGILPVHDASGEAMNANFDPNLTYLLYTELISNPGVQPVLLSPGALYDPDGEEWLLEFARRSNVDALLITRQLPSVSSGWHQHYLRFEAQALNVATGDRSPKELNEEVKLSDYKLLMNAVNNASIDPMFRHFWTGDPKVFKEQPIGKAAVKLVTWTQLYLQAALPALNLPLKGRPMTAPSTSCQVNFSIHYTAKRTSSKAYSLIVNDKEESSTIREGVASFPMVPGSLAIRVRIEDAPYRMPTQALYQSSTVLDCSRAEKTLTMDLGNAGEALLRWE
jgi:hypothetical protein